MLCILCPYELGAQSCKGLESKPLQDRTTSGLISAEDAQQKLVTHREKSTAARSQCRI